MKKLLYFSKTNCAPCAFTKPRVEAVATVRNLPLEYVDCSPGRSAEIDALIVDYGIRSVPALVVLEGDHTHGILLGSAITAEAIDALVYSQTSPAQTPGA